MKECYKVTRKGASGVAGDLKSERTLSRYRGIYTLVRLWYFPASRVRRSVSARLSIPI